MKPGQMPDDGAEDLVHPAGEAGLEKAGSTVHLEDAAPLVSRWLPVALASALFMDLLDSAALGTALPTLAREFHADILDLKLALTAYLLTMAVFVSASGWLADRFGARRVFVNALKIYLLGSICCGLSSSVPELVAGRVIQGFGGAMMTPVARLIVVASTPREGLVKALNAFTIPAIIGPLLGPPLAGLLLNVASWRWIFFINLPVGLIGVWAVLRLVPRLRHPHPGRFDLRGFLLAGGAIIAFVCLAEVSGTAIVPWPWALGLALVAVACAVAFVFHARRMDRPVLDLSLLGRRTFGTSMLGATVLRLGFGATPYLVPMLLQVGLGWTPLQAGSVMVCMMVGSAVARFGGALAVRHVGFRATLIVTGLAAAVFTAVPALFKPATPVWMIGATLLVLGFARASHFVAASPLTYAEVSPGEVSRASTLSTVIQQLGLSMGVSLAGITLAWSSSDGMTLSSFAAPFLVLGVFALLTVPIYARLTPNEGQHMRGSV